MSSYRLSCSLFVAALLFCASVRAEGSEDEAALAHGIALRRERKDEEALAEFRRAYAILPTPRALAQIALAEAALKRWVAAEKDLLEALASHDPWFVRQEDAFQLALKEIRAHIGVVEVSGSEGAELWMDGISVGRLPTSVRAPAKRVALEVRAPGFRAVRREIDVSPGAIVHEVILLEAYPPSPQKDRTARERGAGQRWRVLAWASAGAAGAFLVEGAGATIFAADRAARYNSGTCDYGGVPRSVRCADYASQIRAAVTVEVVGYTAAAIAATAATFLFIASPPAKGGNARVWCAPSLGGASCGYVY